MAAKLWLTPIVGRMLPGSGKIPFLLSFSTIGISYVAFYKDFKQENKTQPVQSLTSLPKITINTRNLPVFSEKVGLRQFKKVS